MNAHIRDQFRETSPFTVTTAGDLSYANAANSMNSRLGIGTTGWHLVVNDGGTAPTWRGTDWDNPVARYETDGGSGSTGYVDLGNGPAIWDNGTGTASVSVAVTTGSKAMVWIGASWATSDTAGGQIRISYAVSGATTVASSLAWGARFEANSADDTQSMARASMQTGLTGGGNTFTFQAAMSVTTHVDKLENPYIMVMGL